MWLTILISFAIILWIYLKWTKKPSNYPPGPGWFPFVGNSPLLKKLTVSLGGLHLALAHLSEKYKTNVLGLQLGRDYTVIVFSYELVKEVLTSEAYEGRPDNFFVRLRCMGSKKGVTLTDEDVWKEQRTFVARHLRNNMGFGKHKMETMVKEEVAEILKIIKYQQKPINFSELIAPAIINILWRLVAGQRIPRNDSKLNKIIKLFDERNKAFDMSGGLLLQLPWLRFVAPELTGYNLMQKLNKQLKELFLDVINDHLTKWTLGKNDDLIFSFIGEMNATTRPSNFTIEQLIAICVDLFIAGSMTTSSTINFAFLMMILHPEIQSEVHNHLDDEFPDNYSLTYSDIEKVPFIQAVILEIERYCFIAPVLGPRRVLKDTVLDGYTIPKGTTVLTSFYSIHRDKDYWKDPDVFRPQRFLDENGSLTSYERVMPFSLGKRRCLGEVLARQCIFMMFVEIMRKYAVCLQPGTEIPLDTPVPGILLTPKNYEPKFIYRKNIVS